MMTLPVLITTSAATLILLIFGSIVIVSAYFSCQEPKQFHWDLMAIIVGLLSASTFLIMTGIATLLSNTLESKATKAAELNAEKTNKIISKNIIQKELKDIRKELNNLVTLGDLTDFDVRIREFNTKIGQFGEEIDSLIDRLYSCEKVAGWLAEENQLQKMAIELRDYTQRKYKNISKAQLRDNIYLCLGWLMESIKVNNFQSLDSSQLKLNLARPNDYRQYEEALNYMVQNKLPKYFTESDQKLFEEFVTRLFELINS